MAVTERPTLDQLADTARIIVTGAVRPEMTYIAEDTVKRRIACGAAQSRSSHDEHGCLAETLLNADDPGHRQAGVELSSWLARRYG